MGRKRINNVYRHYMLHEESQSSTCLLCYKTLNSTHGSNLMNHLKFLHKSEYQQILALNNRSVHLVTTPPRVSPSHDDDSNQSEPGLEVDVDKFFSMEAGSSRVRCDVCQASVEKKGSNLISHLKREHPKMLKTSNDDSDADGPDDNLYQEVVYLYDSDSKSTPNITPSIRPLQLAPTTPASSQKTVKQMSRIRSHSRERKRRRTQDTATSPPLDEFNEELENFGSYVTCLMKTIPKELCTQLQMQIINIIMTAKIKHMSKQEAGGPVVVDRLDAVSVAPCNQSVVVTVDASNLDRNILSPDSNIVDINRTDIQ